MKSHAMRGKSRSFKTHNGNVQGSSTDWLRKPGTKKCTILLGLKCMSTIAATFLRIPKSQYKALVTASGPKAAWSLLGCLDKPYPSLLLPTPQTSRNPTFQVFDMEEWKFIDFTNYSSPYALSFTAERWGLEPFPGNLVAAEGYWDPATGLNNTGGSVWSLPYTCADSASSFFERSYTGDNDIHGLINQTRPLSPSDTLCSEPTRCSQDGCILLIEGIGRATTGPLDSDIIGLSYGLTFLFALFSIIAIMGCCASTETYHPPDEPDPPSRLAGQFSQPSPNIVLREYYNPPPQPQQLYPSLSLSRDNRREVVECAGLLRQLYTLDLEIWGMEKCIAEDMPQKEGYCRQANDVFSQIKTMVNAWPRDADFGWNREEKTIIEEIRHAVNCYPAQRYDASSRIVSQAYW